MNFFQTVTRNAIITFVCALPLVAHGENAPNHSQNSHYDQKTSNSGIIIENSDNREEFNRYYPNYNSCQPCNPSTSRRSRRSSATTPIIIGVTAIGAGALGAALVKGKKGGSGDDGSDGAAGAAGAAGATGGPGTTFTPDIGEFLTFTLTALFPTITPAGTVTAIPFVTAPDGETFEGGLVVITGGTINFPAIVIPDPVFGFYNLGLVIFNTTSNTLAGITLNGSRIVATRDASTSTELTPVAGATIAPGESQVSNTFTYGPANVP